MKRTEIKRRTPIERRTRVKARRSRPRRRVGACRKYLDWLATEACRILGKRTGEYATTDIWGELRVGKVVVDPAHVRTKRLGGDLYNAISLAHHLHEEQHRIGIKSFAAKYGVDLTELARQQTEEFLALHPEFRA